MANVRNMEHLLHNTQKIVDHHHKMMIAKGEHFNLFSILGIESRENKTHSAFLAELLNPKGSHLQKDKFLKLFLQLINRKLDEKIKDKKLELKFISTTNTEVSTEFHISNVNIKAKEGGRIDIYIKNGNHHLCIENKIYAPDQDAQIQRYCNHEKENNTVLYLTLLGKDASAQSRGGLKAGEDYYILSYRDHIVAWLELCLKEVPNLTSVRESINQYILLIKKLTNTLNMEEEMELQGLMTNYLEESRFIATRYHTMVNDFKRDFRKDVKLNLNKRLGEGFEIKIGKDIGKLYSKLWIQPQGWKELGIKFGLEPFSGKGNVEGHLFIGFYSKSSLELLNNLPAENKINNVWQHTKPILTEDGNRIKLNDLYSLKKLAQGKSSEYDTLIDNVVNQSIEFINVYKGKIAKLELEEKSNTSVESLN